MHPQTNQGPLSTACQLGAQPRQNSIKALGQICLDAAAFSEADEACTWLERNSKGIGGMLGSCKWSGAVELFRRRGWHCQEP